MGREGVHQEVSGARGSGRRAGWIGRSISDGVQICSRLQQVRGVGMAQGVNAALLADASAEFGDHADLRAGGTTCP
jgi:hypothetical protein